MADFDLAIIGGGINGAGIARDAAGRGLRVLLVEQNDLASGTSSASTKLIHGGLRYLEHGAFRLVREALTEREVLLRMAPHIIRPLRFVLPPQPGMRSSLLLRFGLFIYDHLGGRKILPPTRTLDLTHHVVGQPLKRRYRTSASSIPTAGSTIPASSCSTRSTPPSAAPSSAPAPAACAPSATTSGGWCSMRAASAKASPRACWSMPRARGSARSPRTILREEGPQPVRLVKGSHIVVRKLFEHDCAYIFQNRDGRVVFAMPFERDFTLIGTTDDDFKGDLDAVGAERRGDHLSVRDRRTIISAPASRAGAMWCGRLPACARSTTTAPTGRRTSPATMFWSSTKASARRRCSRSMAARSRPIASWPKR